MNLHRPLLAAVLLLVAAALAPAPARADELVCAAVYACDERGEVLPEFQGGECESVYRAQCARDRIEQGTACSEAFSKLEDRSKKLQKRVNRLSKLLRTSRSAAR